MLFRKGIGVLVVKIRLFPVVRSDFGNWQTSIRSIYKWDDRMDTAMMLKGKLLVIFPFFLMVGDMLGLVFPVMFGEKHKKIISKSFLMILVMFQQIVKVNHIAQA